MNIVHLRIIALNLGESIPNLKRIFIMSGGIMII